MSYYDDDEDLDIHVHRGHSPRPVRYVQSPPRPRYYDQAAGPSFLVPEQRTTVVARSASRSRSRDRRASSPYSAPAPPPPQPVIINNRIYNDNSSDEDDDRRYRQVARRRRDSRSRSRSRSRDRAYMSREDWEAEQARRELERLRITNARDKDERRLAKEYRDEAELQRAKRELEDIKGREIRAEEEKRIKRDLELKRLKEEEAEAEEKKRREKEAEEAVERYKQKEQERIAKEKKRKEEYDREYKLRLQEDLIKSGLDEKAIAAIVNKEKIQGTIEAPKSSANRATFTRMARRHLSIETLRTFQIEFDVDTDPEYVLIKRWVPEWEQDQFWRHTKYIREKRGKLLMIEEKKHHKHEPEFEWVRKKEHRKRSKSPSVLMYLAGGRPS